MDNAEIESVAVMAVEYSRQIAKLEEELADAKKLVKEAFKEGYKQGGGEDEIVDSGLLHTHRESDIKWRDSYARGRLYDLSGPGLEDDDYGRA